jgi:predicted ATPase
MEKTAKSTWPHPAAVDCRRSRTGSVFRAEHDSSCRNGWRTRLPLQLRRALIQFGQVFRLEETGARLWLPMFRRLEAEACAEAGDLEAGLQAIEEALALSKETGECWELAEVLRVKARLLQSVGQVKAEDIETLLLNSLGIARAQQARCWELRASCDLARLWQNRGQRRKALNLLGLVYGQFTEGFDTADLREAKTLMRRLRQR